MGTKVSEAKAASVIKVDDLSPSLCPEDRSSKSPPNDWYPSATLHGVTFQKTVISNSPPWALLTSAESSSHCQILFFSMKIKTSLLLCLPTDFLLSQIKRW
jgi:hypothetical protein